MTKYDYKGYQLFSNGLQSRPRVDVYFVRENQTLRAAGTFTSLDQAMKAIDAAETDGRFV